jgi:transcription elongation GreA/GreB family factor
VDTTNGHGAVGIGCEVLIRSFRPEGERAVELPAGLRGASAEQVVAIAEEMGVYKLTTRTPMGWALLGARVGDVVSVRSQACTVRFEVLAIAAPATRMVVDARVAELADAAVLKTAPEKVPGSNPGAGTITLDAGRAVQLGDVVDVRDGELEEWWRVVPDGQADAIRRWISEKSALGLALLGHHAGEVVTVRPPAVHGEGGAAWPVTILAVTAAGVPA